MDPPGGCTRLTADVVARPGDRSPGRAVPAWSLVVGGVVSVQFGGALAATVIPALGPTGTVALRLGLGMLILLVIVRPSLRRLTLHDVAAVVGFGIVLGLMNLSFYEALARLPMGVAVTIEFVGPLGLAAALSRRRRDVAAVSLAALGVVAVNGRELGHINWAGVGFALLAGTMWAAYVLLSGEAGQRLPKLDGLALAMVVASAVVVPLGVVHAGSALLEPRHLLLGLAIAVLSSVLPYSLELIALRRRAPSVFGVLMSLEPAVAAAAGFIVLDQRLGALQLAGMACVVAASITITRRAKAASLDI